MGSSSNLQDGWDFSHGRDFERKIKNIFGTTVHHNPSSRSRPFFLLAVFRRFTFRLTEDSVSVALQSCLGGSAADLQVTALQDRHFRFAVSSKRVGFAVYDLKMFTGKAFDVYFFLWPDGGSNWIRDRRIWHRECEAEWTKVLSCRDKKALAKVQSRQVKRNKNQRSVRFAPNLIMDSPKVKSSPTECKIIKFGSLVTSLDSTLALRKDGNNGFRVGSFKSFDRHSNWFQNAKDSEVQNQISNFSFLDCGLTTSSSAAMSKTIQCSSNKGPKGFFRKSILKTSGTISQLRVNEGITGLLAESRELIPEKCLNLVCSRCLSPGHVGNECTNEVRCTTCYCYGHVSNFCLNKRIARKIFWKPKVIEESSSPAHDEAQQSMPTAQSDGPEGKQAEAEGSGVNARGNESATQPLLTVHSPTIKEQSVPPPILQQEERAKSPLNSDTSPALSADQQMANFPIDPAPYLPIGVGPQVGWLRPARGRLAIAGDARRRHEEYAIVSLIPPPGPEDRVQSLEAVVQHLENNMGTREFITAAVAPYGKVTLWNPTGNKSKVILRAKVIELSRIPRSLIVSEVANIGGQGRSWTVPVYILSSRFTDNMMGDEEPLPLDGNPHPVNGPIIPGNQTIPIDWLNELGNGLDFGHDGGDDDDGPGFGGVHGHHGGGHGGNNDDDDHGHGGNIMAMVAMVDMEMLPRQAASQGQNFDDASAANGFLRAGGANVVIRVPSAVETKGSFAANRYINHENENSNPTDVSPFHLMQGPWAPSVRASTNNGDWLLQLCPKILISRSANMPPEQQLLPRLSSKLPIRLQYPVDNTLAIIPYQPLIHIEVLKFLIHRDNGDTTQDIFSGTATSNNNAYTLTWEKELDELEMEAHDVTGFEADNNLMMMCADTQENNNVPESNLPAAPATKETISVTKAPQSKMAKRSNPPPQPPTTKGRKRKMQTPIVDSGLRRSTRLSKNKTDLVQLSDKPHQKEKAVPQSFCRMATLDQGRNLEEEMTSELVTNVDEIANFFIHNTIPIPVMQAWGSNLCGVSPSVLTAKLLQDEVPNEDEASSHEHLEGGNEHPFKI
ncbi:hypothetical protein EJB05_55348, partial [Eragrostis curvula]